MDIRVAVVGASGRMGQAAVHAIESAEDMRVVARIGSSDSLTDIQNATHILDLTVPDATENIVRYAVENGMHAVVGTTGWDAPRLENLRNLLEQHPQTGVLIAPNFAIGSILATRFATFASRFFESVEIVEAHHPQKVDAPSGTAIRTAELINAERSLHKVPPSPDATVTDNGHSRGALIGDVHVHAIRLRGLTAHQKVLLGNPGEQLVIEHDTFDRESFMPGVLLGLRTVAKHPGLTVGIEHFLEL